MRSKTLLILVLTLFAGCTSPEATNPNAPVQIASGQVLGEINEDGDIQVYKGIPYAASTAGAMRWKPPQPAPSWDGVREGTEFGDACIQNLDGSRPPWTEPFMHQGEISEDCLNLNIWVPTEQTAPLPVLVYIHGGGFNEGSNAIAVYDGEALAQKGLVVVTINYRMGVLGFLAHPELTAEEGTSGNFGMLDQVAALEWVRDNIAAFGGDPGNVTISGQSAGAMSIYLLTASPLARGLFHRAIVQSGPGGLASFGLTGTEAMAGPLAEAEATGVQFADTKGASSLKDLREMPVEALMQPVEDAPPMRFRPIVDGHFLTDDIVAVYAAGNQNDTPMMSGFNADEGSAFPGYGKMSVEEFTTMATERYGSDILAHYPVSSDEEAGEAQKQSGRDLAAVAIGRLAGLRARTAATPEYLYYFERGIPWPAYPDFGAFHTGEVPYVFNTLDKLDRPWEDIDWQLTEQVTSYWANFATSGNPNGNGLPQWPAFEDAPDQFMVLGAETGPQTFPVNIEVRAFFEKFLAQ